MKALCQKIYLPAELTQEVLLLHNDPDFAPDLSKLFREETWIEGLTELQVLLGEDPKGIRALCCMLRCALEARAEYTRLGIPDEIYYDTMGCFSRFVQEHKESFGHYGFDRGFWTVRQVSCKLFRIGQLEYELTAWKGQKVVSIHIPTDVALHLPLLRRSWQEAKDFLSRFFPEYANVPMVCSSWLLGPTLEQLLPPQSNILAFQRSFRRTELSSNSTSYVRWVFKNPNLTPEAYPENTSLQRKLKAYLLGGGTFISAAGVLSENPFLQTK